MTRASQEIMCFQTLVRRLAIEKKMIECLVLFVPKADLLYESAINIRALKIIHDS